MNMQGKIVAWAVKGASVLTASALGMALTVIPAVAATDTNLSGFDAAGIESQSYDLGTDGRVGNKGQVKTIGNQKMVANVDASKDAMPDNPSQQLPDKVSAAVPDDATVISKDLAATKDGQVKDLETGEVVTDPKLVGTEDTPPDPLEVTEGKRFIPVDASEVKEAVENNGGDASAAADAGIANSAATPSKATAKGSVHTAALQNNQYGAYWGWHNNTQAFFERGGNLFAQQAKGVVDVSEHQGGIDWQTAKNSGVEGAIIRIGFGWGNRMDYQAARNVSECKRLGIPFGVYLYSYAYDNNSAWAEGNDVVNKLRQLGVNPGDLTFPVYYDLERWSWTGHTPPTNPWVYDGMVNTWYGCLQNNGYNNLSIYSYTSYLNTALNTGNIRAKTRWVASYGARTGFGFSSNDRAWQYADNGGINGINGNVDLNAFGNYNYASNINLCWQLRQEDIAVGAAVNWPTRLEYKWQSYNVNTGSWNNITDWNGGNWAGWSAEVGDYWLHLEVREAETQKSVGEKTIAFRYSAGTAAITGTYAGYRNNGILLGMSSNDPWAKYVVKIYDYNAKRWVAQFWGQWATWQPARGVYWTHYELYTSDGRLANTRTYAFGV